MNLPFGDGKSYKPKMNTPEDRIREGIRAAFKVKSLIHDKEIQLPVDDPVNIDFWLAYTEELKLTIDYIRKQIPRRPN